MPGFLYLLHMTYKKAKPPEGGFTTEYHSLHAFTFRFQEWFSSNRHSLDWISSGFYTDTGFSSQRDIGIIKP